VTLALALDSTLTPTTETLNLAPTPTSTLTLALALALTPNPQPSKVSSDEEVEKVSQEEERTQIATDFEASEDWLYEDGKASIPRPSTPTLNPDPQPRPSTPTLNPDPQPRPSTPTLNPDPHPHPSSHPSFHPCPALYQDLVAADYQKKKRELEKQTSPIFLRLSELEARPRVVKHANEAINWTKTMLETWVTERPEVRYLAITPTWVTAAHASNACNPACSLL
jgi:hypothetical protein